MYFVIVLPVITISLILFSGNNIKKKNFGAVTASKFFD
jgi:hypothetical protein